MLFTKKRKKGQFFPMEMIIKILLAVVGFFFIAVLLYKIFTGLQAESVEQACRASVVAKAKFRDLAKSTLGGAGEEAVNSAYPVQCLTQQKTVPEDTTRGMSREQVRERTLKEMADMSVSCWWMFANGRYHDIFDDDFGNDNKCHICYTFTLNPSMEALSNPPLNKEDLVEYMMTHKYEPGLLQGGGALTAVNALYEYEPQDVQTSTRESRRMTKERLLASTKSLQQGVADFTGTFDDDQQQLEELKDNLLEIHTLGLAPIIVIIPSLGTHYNEDERDEADMAMRILEEWQVGESGLNNGMVFLFSLNDGVLHYAADIGAHAVLHQAELEEEVILATLEEELSQGQADVPQALLDFTKRLKESVLEEEDIESTLQLQGTYMAYITGGKVGATTTENPRLDAAGALIMPNNLDGDATQDGATEEDKGEFIPGVQYAISYVSPRWDSMDQSWGVCYKRRRKQESLDDGCFLFSEGSFTIPNAISVSLRQDLKTSWATCSVVEED